MVKDWWHLLHPISSILTTVQLPVSSSPSPWPSPSSPLSPSPSSASPTANDILWQVRSRTAPCHLFAFKNASILFWNEEGSLHRITPAYVLRRIRRAYRWPSNKELRRRRRQQCLRRLQRAFYQALPEPEDNEYPSFISARLWCIFCLLFRVRAVSPSIINLFYHLIDWIIFIGTNSEETSSEGSCVPHSAVGRGRPINPHCMNNWILFIIRTLECFINLSE